MSSTDEILNSGAPENEASSSPQPSPSTSEEPRRDKPTEEKDKATARLRLRVTTAAESRLRAGHPWLFEQSIREQNRQGRLGEIAAVYDKKDRFLAAGLYDPDSMIRLRVLQAGKPQPINYEWWTERLATAFDRRNGLFDENTTGYRWINGESDGWPGLVLDRYANALVLKLYTAAWLPHLRDITTLISSGSPLVLRLSRNIQDKAAQLFRRHDGEILRGTTPAGPMLFRESGLLLEADILRGQKTGFFLDQRENRRLVESLSRGRRVLNAFSFSGGFSLYAARGGAKSVTDVDLSKHALQSGARNFTHNRSVPAIAACVRKAEQADVFEWLRQSAMSEYDLIVLDPPSLAKRETERPGAIRAYGQLADLGLERLAAGGVLVACSCSAHVTATEFFDAVRQAVRRSGRKMEELRTTRHAPDHPATIPEAQYLKAIYFKDTSGAKDV